MFKNGNLYEGEMNNNKRNGKGIYIQNKTGWFKGHFKDDLKNGEGLETRTRKNALFLSVSSQWNVGKAEKINPSRIQNKPCVV